MKMVIGSFGAAQEDTGGLFCSLVSQYFCWAPEIVVLHKFSRVLGK